MSTPIAPSDLHLELEQLRDQLRNVQQKVVELDLAYRHLDPDALGADTLGEPIDGPEAHTAILIRLEVLRSALDTTGEALDETLPYSSRLTLS